MNLEKKKRLAARALDVGVNRIRFNVHRLNELKEAITKQDMRDLASQGAVIVTEPKGRRKVEARGRRRAGSIRKKVKPGKIEYVRAVRKLRASLSSMKKQGSITTDQFKKLRQEIRARTVRTKPQLTERINLLKK